MQLNPLRFFAPLSVAILTLLSHQIMLAHALASSDNSPIIVQSADHLFVSVDSLPNFADFKWIAWQHIEDFDRLLASFPACAFYDVPCMNSEALSDHLITWSEFAQCLNSAATLYSPSHPDVTSHNLWTIEIQPYITRRVVNCPILGSPFFTKSFSYDVVPEHADEAAILPIATAQRYVNWRNLHYWLYRQLQQEEAVLNQQQIVLEPDDRLTTYFKKKNLYPPIDVVQQIDHTDEILAKGTEVGYYCLAENGDTVESIDPRVPFSLPTTVQKRAWDAQYADQFPLSGDIWTAELAESNTDSTPEAAIQLAVNKNFMMQSSHVTAAELKHMAQEMQQHIALLKSTHEYQEASRDERIKLERVFLNMIGCLGLLIGGSELTAVLDALPTLQLLSHFSDIPLSSAVVSLIDEGVFSAEDCVAANRILSTYRRGANRQLTQEQIQSIVSRKLPVMSSSYFEPPEHSLGIETTVYSLTDRQCAALAKAYQNKFRERKMMNVFSAVSLSLFCFYFGNSSNIDSNY